MSYKKGSTHGAQSVDRKWLDRKLASQFLKSAFLSLIAICASSGAYAQKVTAEADESVDFSKFKTFVVASGQMNSRAPALNSELTKKRVELEIVKAFTAKGLTVSADHADLNVSFEFGSARIVESRTVPAGPRGMGSRVANIPESEGTLVIDLHDPSTNMLIWRSVATDAEKNPAKLAEKLGDLVKKAVSKYPTKKKK